MEDLRIPDIINTIICADSLEILKALPSKSIDLVLTDPPYGLDMDIFAYNSGQTNTKNGFKPHAKTEWDKRISKDYFNEIFRVSKNQIIWGANYYPQYLTPSMGWIFWNKMQHNFSFSDGEFAFTSFQKKARCFNYARGNESGFSPKGSDAPNAHPTQKPVALGKYCLDKYSSPEDIVLDCFCGSGTFILAAEMLGRKWIGIDISPKYCAIAEKRIKLYQSQGKLEL